MRRVRALNPDGVAAFDSYLAALGSDPTKPPPMSLLDDPSFSVGFTPAVQIDQSRWFDSRLEAGQYLAELLGRIERSRVDHNAGLWSWLALLYFDQLCPADHGKRQPKRSYAYILPPLGDVDHHRHYYRHRLAGPYRIVRLHPGSARSLLSGQVSKFDDYNEQIASRQEFITNSGIVSALDLLYFDSEREKPKRGAAANKRKPGTLRRFVDVIQQLELTHDLYSMDGHEILEILPAEFEKWKPDDGSPASR